MDESSLRKLLDLWEGLEERERRCVLLYTQRIYRGQKVFGALTKGKKNWAKETVEEGIDAAVYLTALAIDLEDDGTD